MNRRTSALSLGSLLLGLVLCCCSRGGATLAEEVSRHETATYTAKNRSGRDVGEGPTGRFLSRHCPDVQLAELN